MDPVGGAILLLGIILICGLGLWDDRRVQRRHDAWLDSLHKH